MVTKFRCIKKNYNNSNVLISMDLVNLSTGQTLYAVAVPAIKDKILANDIELEGFVIESGKLLDKRGKKQVQTNDVLAEYYNSCKLLGIKPLKIVYNNGEYVLVEIPTGSEVIIPKFVNRINVVQNKAGIAPPQLPAIQQNNTLDVINSKISNESIFIRQDLQDIKKALSILGTAISDGFSSTTQELNNLYDEIKNQNLTVQEYVDTLVEKLDYLVNVNVKKYEFPKYKNDKHFLSHYSKTNILESEDIFNEAVIDDPSNFGILTYNEDLFKKVTEICKVVNDIRMSMESVYNTDIKRRNLEGVKRNKAKVKDLVKLMEYAWVMQAGTELLKAGSTITAYTVIFAGVGALGYALTEAMPIIKTTKNKLNSYRNYDGGDINPRLQGVYNGVGKAVEFSGKSKISDEKSINQCTYQALTVNNISYDIITANEDIFNSFSVDINAFVVDCMNVLVRKGAVDFSNVKFGKKDDYYKFIKGSLCRYPVDDVSLFNFYCKYYISSYANLYYHNGEYTASNNDIESKKTYFNLVVNAYFTAKKLLLVNPNDCDFAKNCILDNSNKNIYTNFLYIMKIALIVQGITPKYAEELLMLFKNLSEIEER